MLRGVHYGILVREAEKVNRVQKERTAGQVLFADDSARMTVLAEQLHYFEKVLQKPLLPTVMYRAKTWCMRNKGLYKLNS